MNCVTSDYLNNSSHLHKSEQQFKTLPRSAPGKRTISAPYIESWFQICKNSLKEWMVIDFASVWQEMQTLKRFVRSVSHDVSTGGPQKLIKNKLIKLKWLLIVCCGFLQSTFAYSWYLPVHDSTITMRGVPWALC